MAALAALRQLAALCARTVGITLAHPCIHRVHCWRNRWRYSDGRSRVFSTFRRQAGDAGTSAMGDFLLLAGLSYHGDRFHQQPRFLRPTALSPQLWLVFSGANDLWGVRSGNISGLPLVDWNFVWPHLR